MPACQMCKEFPSTQPACVRGVQRARHTSEHDNKAVTHSWPNHKISDQAGACLTGLNQGLSCRAAASPRTSSASGAAPLRYARRRRRRCYARRCRLCASAAPALLFCATSAASVGSGRGAARRGRQA
eukprot:237396-Chlamydomonas_euryale.AAC.1